ncbi:MAG: hypothetical protein JWP09_761 [Candidatus Taylorbacteria bacterium]|nr:hypothetical protein [Candidatus Taylorbacteria bacterium]
MSLQFEDQNNLLVRRNTYQQNYGPIVALLLRFHIAKTEKTANKILFIVSILVFICAATLIVRNVIKANTPVKVKYNLSKEGFNKLPQNVQVKILTQ